MLLLGCYLSMSNALRITTCSNCYLELSRTYKHHEGFFTVLSSLRGFCPAQTRDKLKRFLDSILQKGGKMRSLVRELKDKYSSCDSTTGCLDYLIYIYIMIETHTSPHPSTPRKYIIPLGCNHLGDDWRFEP